MVTAIEIKALCNLPMAVVISQRDISSSFYIPFQRLPD